VLSVSPLVGRSGRGPFAIAVKLPLRTTPPMATHQFAPVVGHRFFNYQRLRHNFVPFSCRTRFFSMVSPVFSRSVPLRGSQRIDLFFFSKTTACTFIFLIPNDAPLGISLGMLHPFPLSAGVLLEVLMETVFDFSIPPSTNCFFSHHQVDIPAIPLLWVTRS